MTPPPLLFEDKERVDEWRVEYGDDHGQRYVAIFSGPASRARARVYCDALGSGILVTVRASGMTASGAPVQLDAGATDPLATQHRETGARISNASNTQREDHAEDARDEAAIATPHYDQPPPLMFADKEREWRVEYGDDHGQRYVAAFSGPEARTRARVYCDALSHRTLLTLRAGHQ